MSDETREFIVDRLKMDVVYEGSLADLFKSFSNINSTVRAIEIAVDRYTEDNEEYNKVHFMEWLTGQLEGCGRLIGTVDYDDLPSYEQKKFTWFDELDKYLYADF